MVRLYIDANGALIVSKTVDYPAAGSTVPTSDEIKNFKVRKAAADSLEFQVDYTCSSDQGNTAKVTAKIKDGGYPVDWLKCSKFDVQKGSGVAVITCNFGSATTMPPGVYGMSSDQILVQLEGGGNSSPIVSKSFNYSKTWSLDNLSNFRDTGITGNEVSFLVDYVYNSSHGAFVGLGANAIIGGTKRNQLHVATQNIKKGSGTAAGTLIIPPGGNPIEQVFVSLYEAGGSEFFAKYFDYPK